MAELSAAFLCADLDLTPELRADLLKSDNRAIFAAASHAQRAADFLHGLQATAPAQADAA